MLRKIAVVVAAFALMCFAKDSFLTSCQKKWNANVENVKSFRADMVQTMTFNGVAPMSQSMNVMYLKSDRPYMKMAIDVSGLKSTMICRGDTMFVKTGDSKWSSSQGNCSTNPLMGVFENVDKANMKFVEESKGVRVYRDSLKIQYKIQTRTCRILEAENDEMTSSWEYELRDNIDLPLKNSVMMKANSAIIEQKIKNVLINQGVTKSYFEVR